MSDRQSLPRPDAEEEERRWTRLDCDAYSDCIRKISEQQWEQAERTAEELPPGMCSLVHDQCRWARRVVELLGTPRQDPHYLSEVVNIVHEELVIQPLQGHFGRLFLKTLCRLFPEHLHDQPAVLPRRTSVVLHLIRSCVRQLRSRCPEMALPEAWDTDHIARPARPAPPRRPGGAGETTTKIEVAPMSPSPGPMHDDPRSQTQSHSIPTASFDDPEALLEAAAGHVIAGDEQSAWDCIGRILNGRQDITREQSVRAVALLGQMRGLQARNGRR